MDNAEEAKKKSWTHEERLELAAKLDAELDDYVNSLEKRPYAEGWPADRWEEEMEKHPFFMTKCPEPGEELSPLMEGLQQLKYSETDNTPEELANNYKEDGNFNYKYKKYRMAIISYTEGIKTKCKDPDLMAQLYNNRAASHFMLKNYRSSLNDCKCALKLKSDYTKALSRAAQCCFQIKDYDECITYCDKFLERSPTDKTVLSLRVQAVSEWERMRRDKRKKERFEKLVECEEENLLEIIKSRGINLKLKFGQTDPVLIDLEPQIPEIADSRVHLDGTDRLIWPTIITYPETLQIDYIQNFHEDSLLLDELAELFIDPPEWDTERRYRIDNINVYFEGKKKLDVHKVSLHKTLGEILQDERFVVRGGAPAFLVVIKDSKAEWGITQSYPTCLK